jgi:uncharacterized protein (DUF58 family)
MSRAHELTLTGFLLCATAALLGVPALYLPGIAALLATPAAWLWVTRSAKRTQLGLRCAAASAEEGEPVQVEVTVSRGLLPFPGGTLLPWPGAAELALPLGRTLQSTGNAVIARRGRHRVGPARVRLTDPFGLCTRELDSASSELLVLPRIHRLDASALAFLDGVGGSSREPPQALDSLPTVARTGVLMERSLRAEDEPSVLVELDTTRPDSETELDIAVRAAASLCLHLARRGGCLVALPDEPRPTPLGADLQGWPALHARMAVLQTRTTARRAPPSRRGLSLIRVTASSDPAGAPAGPHCRVSPSPVPGAPALFEIAGCTVQLLGARRDLQAA